MITVRNLSKTVRGKKILEDLNLDIKGITGIIGPNGAGKSTLMRILASVDQADQGSEITFSDSAASGSIGYLPQDFSVYPNLTVFEVLKLLASLKGNVDTDHTNELLDSLHLTVHKNKKIKELSGGTRRRVGIAQALLNKPHYLIIDEPSAGLDILECLNLRNILLRVSERTHIIISSHLAEDIEFICDHIIIIDEGKKKFEGSLDEMKKNIQYHTYEALIEQKNLSSLDEIGEIIKVEKRSQGIIKVQFVTDKKVNHENFRLIDTGFVAGYVSLLKSELRV